MFFSSRIKFFAAPTAGLLYNNYRKRDGVKCDIGGNWVNVRKDVEELLDSEKYMDEPVGPIFVRLAWHSSGTWCKHTRTGGSDGATMRFEPEKNWGANAGLQKARDILEPLKKKHDVSYSDLWVFAGVVALEEMSGKQMYIGFREGRRDAHSADQVPKWQTKEATNGKLPAGDMGSFTATADHLRDIFYRIGFNDQEIVALSGAHALGRCHPTSSGYKGPWSFAPTTFSNEYFRLLLEEDWKVKTKDGGKKWTGPVQYEDKTGELMMLPSDIALIKDPKFKAWVQKYAADEELFFKDFSAAFRKLVEFGVPFEARHGGESASTWFRRVNSVRTGVLIAH